MVCNERENNVSKRRRPSAGVMVREVRSDQSVLQLDVFDENGVSIGSVDMFADGSGTVSSIRGADQRAITGEMSYFNAEGDLVHKVVF